MISVIANYLQKLFIQECNELVIPLAQNVSQLLTINF